MSTPARHENLPRLASSMVGGPQVVRIWLLGGFRVSVGSRTIEEHQWGLKKATALVKLLALARDHRFNRERAMDLLWPGLGKDAASNNLRRTLHAARGALDAEAGSRYLASVDESLVLCPGGPLWVDVDAFERVARMARSSKDLAAYRAAIELYAGELLPEDRYEEWAEERREGLRQVYLQLLFEVAGAYEERGEYERGIEALRTVVAEEPILEEAYAGLMRLHALSDQRGQALIQYERLRGALSSRLGAEPGETTKRLRDEIVAGGFPSSPTLPAGPLLEGKGETPDAGKHNLPSQRTSFVGREQEMVEVKRLLSMTRLLTLTGAGGSGKTRLALEVARDLVASYRDGVRMVELASLSEGDLVAQEVARALGVLEQPGRPLVETLIGVLHGKDMLLILDNCEHLAGPVARLLDKLLDSCPRLRALATSRESLRVDGEVIWRMASLSVPDAERLPAAEDLTRYESVRLFRERARLKLPAFEITPDNARPVAEVCRRLDGIPLAIELATARMGALAVEHVSERLEDSLGLLSGGARTASPRQQTMRATIGWSHELLSEPEKQLFQRLSVFAGGWTLEAGEAVAPGPSIAMGDALSLMNHLVDKSLVQAKPSANEGAIRYRMLEPVRQYAREKLEESGEAEQVRERHAKHYLAFAGRAERELSGRDQALWLDRLEIEHDNLRVALRWSLDGNEAELGLKLAAALWLFWYTRGYLSEGREWLEKAASLGGARQLRLKAWALCNAGNLASLQGELGIAKRLVEESLVLFRELEDKGGIVSALTMLGAVAMLGQQDLETVPVLYEEAMSLKEEVENPRAHAYLLLFSGIVAVGRGDWGRAEALFGESLALCREIRDVQGVRICLTNLGLASVARGDHDRATALFQENLRVVSEPDNAALLHNFVGLACATAAQGQPVRAVRLWGAAEAVQEGSNLRITPMTHYSINHDEHLRTARAQLGEVAFLAAWAEGKAMSQEEAVSFALGNIEPAPPVVPAPAADASGDAGLARMRANALNSAGYLATFQGEYEAAKRLLEEALALFRELKHNEGVASSLAYLAFAAVFTQQDLQTIPALLSEALDLESKTKDRRTVAMVRLVSGLAAVGREDWEKVEAENEEGLRLFREIGDSQGVSICTANLGALAMIKADYDWAFALLKENLRVSLSLSHKAGLHYSFFALGDLAVRKDQPARAAKLWAAAQAMRETFGIYLTPLARVRLDYDANLAAVRARLGEVAFETAWAEGKAMSQEEAVACGLESGEPDAPAETPLPEGEPTRALSRREGEIAALIARGLTNRQIASELSISGRTVETHVRSILRKLGLRSRFQLAER